ncbi:hypothetical protein HZH66_007124 [Vespula vulgaris]|uniref:Uncharacterized protein n=1 Tax=Vespula vulgaris TaxID=7454 RepID=A0A834JXI7_VESVU|nr:hypothetical protein HZH66_007124 [Vespula vulgaris]
MPLGIETLKKEWSVGTSGNGPKEEWGKSNGSTYKGTFANDGETIEDSSSRTETKEVVFTLTFSRAKTLGKFDEGYRGNSRWDKIGAPVGENVRAADAALADHVFIPRIGKCSQGVTMEELVKKT